MRLTSLDASAMRGCGNGARHHVDLLGDRAAGACDDQLRNPGAGNWRDARIGSALVAMRRIGVHAQAARGAADRCGIEPCGLDEHVLRRVGDHRGFAAHHSGKCHGLHGIGDDKVFGQQLALDAVERGERSLQRGRGAQ